MYAISIKYTATKVRNDQSGLKVPKKKVKKFNMTINIEIIFVVVEYVTVILKKSTFSSSRLIIFIDYMSKVGKY